MIIITIVIATALRVCVGGDDDVKEASTAPPPPPIDRALQARIDSFVGQRQHVGALALTVYDMTSRQTVYEYCEKEQHPDSLFRPASCMKLLTCIAALRYLGTRYDYSTRLFTQGTLRGDTLVGDIVFKGHFDPAFNRDSLMLLLTPLRQCGIKAITGRVIIDVAITSPMTHEQHWTLGDLKVRRLGLLYQGLPRLRTEMLWALRSAAGITVRKDSIQLGRMNTHTARQVAEIRTPIYNVVLRALKNSSNINAEALLYVLGYTIDRRGCYRENGMLLLRHFIRHELAMNPQTVATIHDGCGLCPDDRMSPALLVALLRYSAARPSMHAMVTHCLPLSGTDGTLHDRLYRPNVKGQIRAKTGTLTREGGISTLAGYYTAHDGHQMVFVIMNNECPVLDGRWWQDRLLERVMIGKKTVNEHSASSHNPS